SVPRTFRSFQSRACSNRRRACPPQSHCTFIRSPPEVPQPFRSQVIRLSPVTASFGAFRTIAYSPGETSTVVVVACVQPARHVGGAGKDPDCVTEPSTIGVVGSPKPTA